MEIGVLRIGFLILIRLVLCFTKEAESESCQTEELLFLHIPYNFGYTVGLAALYGHSVTSAWSVAEAWDHSRKLFGDKGAQEEKDGAVWFHNHPSATAVKAAMEANPETKLWGGVAPELQELSDVTGCPLYFTPPKYWPKDLAQSYLSGKKVFGILRNPLERLVAMFRGGYSEYGSFPPHFRESCDVNGAIKWLMQSLMNGTVSKYASQCTFIPQVEFFEGPFGVQIAVDNLHFPESLNRMLVYNDLGQAVVEQNVILQIAGCDNIWAGDIDEETKSLVYEYFQADFDLLCQRFGYCDKGTRATCLVQVPGMCPPKNFTWHQTLKRYVPLTKELESE